MNKPLTIVIENTQTKLAQVCNESGLPPIILDLIIKGLYSEIHSIAERQILEDKASYMKTIQSKDVKNNKD